jgi:hypothetical protein
MGRIAEAAKTVTTRPHGAVCWYQRIVLDDDDRAELDELLSSAAANTTVRDVLDAAGVTIPGASSAPSPGTIARHRRSECCCGR